MANNIASERARLGMNQEELGSKVGKDRSTISRWESNPNLMSVDNLLSLMDIFHCSADYLLGRSEERIPKQIA